MIHPHTELRFIHEDIGHGVIATRGIPCGTITWALDPLDRQLTKAELQALPATLNFNVERYTFLGSDGRCILPWDLAAFVNHCCEPNCLTTVHGFEIAIRDIRAGEQLTNDYANLGMHPGERFHCHCGAPGCRRHVFDTDHPRLDTGWQADIARALACAPRVEQPLSGLLGAAQLEVISKATASPARAQRRSA